MVYNKFIITKIVVLKKGKMMTKKFINARKGFTLAETLITLAILGVVAAITVPMLINKQIENANRTKVKKAMAVYEKALNQMVIENDIKNDVGALNGNNCATTTKYFKKVQGDGCYFQTADKVWWDISDIGETVISLKDQITTQAEGTAVRNNKAKTDDKTAFVLVGRMKDGILRINDLGFEKSDGTMEGANNSGFLEKLYAFIENRSDSDDSSDYPSDDCSDYPSDDSSDYPDYPSDDSSDYPDYPSDDSSDYPDYPSDDCCG